MNRTLRTVVCSLFVLTASCSKSNPPAELKGESLVSLLPAQTLGFFSGDIQNSDFNSFFTSEEYVEYFSSMQTALANNKALNGDWTPYFDFIKALGLVPVKGAGAIPYGPILIYASTGAEKRVDVAGYYDIVKGQDGRTLFNNAKGVLTNAKVSFEALPASTEPGSAPHDAIAIKLFSGSDPLPPAMTFYKDALKLEAVYLAANEHRLVLATSKAGLERGFLPGKNESKGLLESETTKKVLADVGADTSGKGAGFGLIDVPTIVRDFDPESADLAKNPVSVIGMAAKFKGKTLLFDSAALVAPKGADQEKAIRVLAGSAASPLFGNLSTQSAVAVSFDGGAMRRGLTEFGDSVPPEEKKKVDDLFAKIQAVSFGFSAAAGTSPYPDVVISFTSSDPAGLATLLKGLTSELPLPPGMTWQPGKVGDVSVDSFPTPLGIKVHLAHDSNNVVIATGDDALTSAMKSTSSTKLSEASVGKSVATMFKGPLLGIIVDYPKLASLMASGMQAAAMFAPQGTPLNASQFDQFKNLGRVAIMLGYEPGLVRLSFAQDMTKSQ